MPLSRNASLGLAAALMLVLVLSQSLASAAAPLSTKVSATGSIGRAGFAYLGGLRTFAAAVLWNRLEPQLHEYYTGVPLAKQDYIIPTLALVQALDPQFEHAYPLSSFFVFRRIGHAPGIEIARRGVANNPQSGPLKASLAQLLFIDDKVEHQAEMLALARSAMAPEVAWEDVDEQFEAYAVFREVYAAAGDQGMVEAIKTVLTQMKADGFGTGDHDHDSDGKQDH